MTTPAYPRPPAKTEKAQGVADIVFLLDVTGSMQPCIDALKENIAAFLQELTSPREELTSPVRDWRARVIGYRDYDYDDAPPLEVFPFVRDAEALRQQLVRLEAKGGGDEEESLLDALYKVALFGSTAAGEPEAADKWRGRSEAARVVVVFTDGPYKERMSLPEARGGTFYDVANMIMAERLIISLFAPDMPCYDYLSQLDKSEYQPIPFDRNEEYGAQRALVEFTSKGDSFRHTLMQLAKSVSKSAETPVL